MNVLDGWPLTGRWLRCFSGGVHVGGVLFGPSLLGPSLVRIPEWWVAAWCGIAPLVALAGVYQINVALYVDKKARERLPSTAPRVLRTVGSLPLRERWLFGLLVGLLACVTVLPVGLPIGAHRYLMIHLLSWRQGESIACGQASHYWKHHGLFSTVEVVEGR